MVLEGGTTFPGETMCEDILIKFRGASSRLAAKRSFSIRIVDAESGKKKATSLLGMGVGKKWALQAECFERTFVRQTLAYELARPLMSFVPDSRYCELFVDGKYYGLYLLSEYPDQYRLNLRKDGVLLYFAHPWQKEGEIREVFGDDTLSLLYRVKYPKAQKQTSVWKEDVETSLSQMIANLETANRPGKNPSVDENDFLEFLISTEFSANGDAYAHSGFLYQHSQECDPVWHICLWDVDGSFGCGDCWASPVGWLFDDVVATRWLAIARKPDYRKEMMSRWRQYRKNEYSDERIESIVDSLSTLLIKSGAAARDAQAWLTYSGRPEPNPYDVMRPISYEDDLRILRAWISCRLLWMDEALFR